MMNKVIDKVLKNKFKILLIFMITFIICLFLSNKVTVNYNMIDYLPENEPSTKALKVMNEEFSYGAPNVRVMLKEVSIVQALEYKNKISKIDGVLEVNFLDDFADLNKPIETISDNLKDSWYKDGNALLTLTIDEDKQGVVINQIKEIIGNKGIMSGDAVNTVAAEESTSKELSAVFLIAIPIILIVLILSTSSFFEPILFLVTIGIAIIINMGTNVILGEISFVTSAASAILQLAVSMDYSIFLLHRFAEFRKKKMDVETAMKTAVSKSFSSILSSGLTTIIGFACLIIMQFKIGPDMGIVMSKGIILSLLCVLILLPILTIYSYKLIDKTAHRNYLPSFTNFANKSSRLRKPLIILFIIVLVPMYLGSIKNDFIYGGSKILSDNTKVGKERLEIEDTFGTSNLVVIMVPKGDMAKEKLLSEELLKKDYVINVQGFAATVGESIPIEYAPEDQLSMVLSKNYSRLVVTINALTESKETFNIINEMRSIASNYYGDNYHMVGTSVSTLDMKDTVISDNLKVNFIAIISILIILLFTFKSLSLPVILILVIEASIWINLSYVYFSGEQLSYIAYLIISSIQLGATIDYAILFTNRYLENRALNNAKEASIKTVSDTFVSILTSSLILMVAGFILGAMSSNSIISQLGFLVGRGALISNILVIFILPGLLVLFDKIIIKTTKNMKVYKKRGRKMKKKKVIVTLLLFVFLTSFMPTVDAIDLAKEENVYGILNSDGSVKNVYVVNSYNNNNDTSVCDFGDYEMVLNLTSTNKLVNKEGKTCFDMKKGKFYYEGRMQKKELPWNINVTYFLNDKKIKGEKVIGRDGNLKIVLDITKNNKVSANFFNDYLLQISMSLNTKKATNIKAEGAILANVSDNKQIQYTVLAGNEKHIEITATVKDFEMDGISINAVPMILDVNLPGANSLTNDLIVLKDSIKMIDNGALTLSSGTNALNNGVDTLKDGALEIKKGMNQLKSNSNALVNGSKQVKDALALIDGGLSAYDDIINSFDDINELLRFIEDLNTYVGNVDEVKKAFGQIKVLYDQLKQNEDQIRELIETLKESGKLEPEVIETLDKILDLYSKNEDKINSIIDEVSNVEEIVLKLNSSIDKIIESLDKVKLLKEGISQLRYAYDKLDDGINMYTDGFDTIYDGYQTLLDGVNSLSVGTNELNNGSKKLSSGTSKLNNQTSSIDVVVDNKIKDILNDFKNEDFTPNSFASENNTNVSSVQFALKTSDLHKKSDVKTVKEETKKTSFFTKLINLFK